MGRTSQRTERRRRVLSEDRREGLTTERAAAGEPPRTSNRPSRRYAVAAQRDQQWSVCDVIPQRRWTIVVWCLVAATSVAAHGAMEALCDWARRRHSAIDLTPLRQGTPAATGQSSLNTFSLCLTFLLASAYAGLILNFRRHRVDDYRGRYRVWYYVGGTLLVAAVMIGSGLTRTVHSMAAELAAASQITPDSAWLSLAAAVLGGAGLVRLVIEMREARGAVALLVTSATLAGGCLAMPATALGDDLQRWLAGMLRLAAAELFLLSTVVYSRHVFLEAQGMAVQRARPRRRWSSLSLKRRGSPATGESGQQGARASLKVKSPPEAETASRAPAPTVARPQSPPPATRATKPSELDASQEDEQPATVNLSRAERRRLAKERRRQQRAA